MNEFWQTCVQKLEQELPPQQISAWIRPLVPLELDEDEARLRVSAHNRFKLDWVRKNFATRIQELASQWYERPIQVMFELASSGAARPSLADRPATLPTMPVQDTNSNPTATVANPPPVVRGIPKEPLI